MCACSFQNKKKACKKDESACDRQSIKPELNVKPPFCEDANMTVANLSISQARKKETDAIIELSKERTTHGQRGGRGGYTLPIPRHAGLEILVPEQQRT